MFANPVEEHFWRCTETRVLRNFRFTIYSKWYYRLHLCGNGNQNARRFSCLVENTLLKNREVQRPASNFFSVHKRSPCFALFCNLSNVLLLFVIHISLKTCKFNRFQKIRRLYISVCQLTCEYIILFEYIRCESWMVSLKKKLSMYIWA